MGRYRCPECFRPEGEMHKGGCSYDFTGFVAYSDQEDRRAQENAQRFLGEAPVPLLRTSTNPLSDTYHGQLVEELPEEYEPWLLILIGISWGIVIGLALAGLFAWRMS